VLGSADIPEVSMTSSTAPGVTHRWANFAVFADEVANARIWAGFHYRFSTRVGTDVMHPATTVIPPTFIQRLCRSRT